MLEGLEDRPINIECQNVKISQDGSQITVSDFVSDMPFIENALNSFASGTYGLPKEGMAGMAVGMLRKVLDL